MVTAGIDAKGLNAGVARGAKAEGSRDRSSSFSNIGADKGRTATGDTIGFADALRTTGEIVVGAMD